VLVGHSLGSNVAMHYAAQHPDVRALVLIDPGRSASHIEVAVERITELAPNPKKELCVSGTLQSPITSQLAHLAFENRREANDQLIRARGLRCNLRSSLCQNTFVPELRRS